MLGVVLGVIVRGTGGVMLGVLLGYYRGGVRGGVGELLGGDVEVVRGDLGLVSGWC